MPLPTFHQNFNTAARQIMADHSLDSVRQLADKIKIPYGTLYKIFQGKNPPTIQHCLIVLKKGKFSADWLFLNHGAQKLTEHMLLQEITAAIKNIRDRK